MNEIICPHCKKAFTIDEAGYADILQQVRDHAFEEALQERLRLAEQEKRTAIEPAEARLSTKLEKEATKKEAEIERLKAELKAAEVAKQLALKDALGTVEKERDRLANELDQLKQAQQDAAQLARERHAHEVQNVAAAKEAEIQQLKARLDAFDVAQKLAITEAVSAVEKERDALKSDVERVALEKQLAEKALKDKYETQIKDRDERHRAPEGHEGEAVHQDGGRNAGAALRDRVRDRCAPRPSRAAYFEKDNDARSGSKGDYIFRDVDEAGTEIVSIMFEMKNESDTTATKKRNEDFLKELDKDRTEKGCEYAVLVSLLEPDNELYNSGIVDVSTATRRCTWCGRSSSSPSSRCCATRRERAEVQDELALVKAQNIDITQLRGRTGVVQERLREELRAGVTALPDGHRRDRQVDRSPAEDQGGAAGHRPQPASGQRQGAGRDDQEADAQEPDDGGEVRGAEETLTPQARKPPRSLGRATLRGTFLTAYSINGLPNAWSMLGGHQVKVSSSFSSLSVSVSFSDLS
jgi:hypothetical protein